MRAGTVQRHTIRVVGRGRTVALARHFAAGLALLVALVYLAPQHPVAWAVYGGGMQGPLVPGELARALRWGDELGGAVTRGEVPEEVLSVA
jgi:hypothetical protein